MVTVLVAGPAERNTKAAPALTPESIKPAAIGKDAVAQNKTFAAITHAKSRIQSLLADRLQCKFCPVLHFYRDEKFKKTLETMKLINQATSELEKKDSVDHK